MNRDKKGGGKKRNHLAYSVQHFAKIKEKEKRNNHKGTWPSTYSKTCRDHGLGLGTKERKTMQKKKKKKTDPYKEK